MNPDAALVWFAAVFICLNILAFFSGAITHAIRTRKRHPRR